MIDEDEIRARLEEGLRFCDAVLRFRAAVGATGPLIGAGTRKRDVATHQRVQAELRTRLGRT